MKNIKNNKGVTLVALIVYIVIFILIIGIMSTISSFFFRNMNNVINEPKYASEFNKFIMFFAVDVKNNSEATVTTDTIKFTDDLIYKYENNCIYRNDLLIAQNISACKFSLNTPYTVNSVTKNIINVYIKMGKTENNIFEENIDFTLKYW